MDYEIRCMEPNEWPLLEDFLYEAIFVPEDFEGEVPRSIIYNDLKCCAAFEDFGTLPDDRAVVATVEGKVVGACWVRTTDEYGHIDDETPSFSISLYKPYRGRGMGTVMMRSLLDELREAGYARASLSVQKENPALRLYKRLGFRIVGDGADETEWLMVVELAEGAWMVDESNLPKFEYHPNLYDLGILDRFHGTCECYGEEGNLFYQGLHCREDVEYVCLDCVASGRAAEKFDGAFNYDHEHVDNPEAIDELEHRTPGLLMPRPRQRKTSCL